MRRVLAFLFFFSVLVSCTESECVDCADTQGNVFTFCDPAQSPFDTLDCGEIYTSVK